MNCTSFIIDNNDNQNQNSDDLNVKFLNNSNNNKNEITLRNGVNLPLVGLGTSHSGGYSHSCVVYALKECGYRLIDTAKRYGTEEFIKYAIQESGIDRKKLFLTTKLWPIDYGLEKTKPAFFGSMQRLGVEYLDLFLIHYPEVSSNCTDKWQTLGDTWRTLELLYDEGLIRSIGVSNYNIDDLERQSAFSSMDPMVNQIEFHPYHYPKELVDYCDCKKIQIQGYCPLGMGNLVNDDQVKNIAQSIGKTPAQVLIRWSLEHNVPTIPKSTKKDRVKENISVFDFNLNEQQMQILDSFNKEIKYQDVSVIKEKIDANLPDGYKLDKNLKEKLFES